MKFSLPIFVVPVALAVSICLHGLSSSAIASQPPITAIAFSPDARSVVVGSQAGLVVRSWPELKLLKKLVTSLANVHDLKFSPDGQLLAVAGGSPTEDGLAEILAWPSGNSLGLLSGHSDSVLAVAWSRDSKLLTASLDHDAALWDVPTGKLLKRYKGHSRGVTSVCFMPNHQGFITAGLDQNLRVWNTDSQKLVRTLNNHTQAIHQLSLRPANSGLPMIASVSEDRTVRLWQPTIGRMVRFAQLKSVPLAVDWLPDGSRVVVVATDGQLRFIDPDTVEITHQLPAVDGWAYSLAVHPSDGSLLVGGRDGQLQRILLESESP